MASRIARVQIKLETAKVFHIPVKNGIKASAIGSHHFNVPSFIPTSIKPNSSVTSPPGPEIPSGYTSIVVPIAVGAIALGFAFVLFFIILDSLCRKRRQRKYEAISESSEHGSETESFKTKKFLYDAYKGFETSDEETSSSNTINSHPLDIATSQIQDTRDIPSTSGLNPFNNNEDQPTKSQSCIEDDDLLNPFLNPVIKEEGESDEEATSIGKGNDYYSPTSYKVNGLTLHDDPETKCYNPFLSTEEDGGSEGGDSECYTPFDIDVDSDVYDTYDPSLNPFTDKKGIELGLYKGR